MLDTVLSYYGPVARDINVVRIRADEIDTDVAGRSLDALAFIAAPRTEEASRIIAVASNALGGS